MADSMYRMMSLSPEERFKKHLEENDEIVEKALKKLRSWVYTNLFYNGSLLSAFYKTFHVKQQFGFLWVVVVVDILYFLSVIIHLMIRFPKLRRLEAAEGRSLSRHIFHKRVIEAYLHQDTADNQERYQELLECKIKKRYRYVVKQAFLYCVLVPLICQCILLKFLGWIHSS